MKHLGRFVIPCLALSVVFAACEDKDTTGIGTQNQANVRFVNAISGVNGNLALTANGAMLGSSQAFGGFTTTCTSLGTGNTTFAFGAPNTGGTGVTSNLATTTSSLTKGNFLAIATGTSTNPQLMILPATSTTTAGTGTANVRVINATGNGAFDVFATTTGGTVGTTPTSSNIAAFGSGSFSNIPITNTTLVFRNAGTTTNAFTASNLSFQSGGNYTVLLLPSSTGTGFQAVTINGSCT